LGIDERADVYINNQIHYLYVVIQGTPLNQVVSFNLMLRERLG
jgi:hypothetical protein